MQRYIFHDDLICLFFNFHQFIPCQWSVEINLNDFLSHMKTDIIISICLMDQTRNNMLTCMILHMIKPSLPVDFTADCCSRKNSVFHIMHNFSIFAMHIKDFYSIDCAMIRILSSTFRIECSIRKNSHPSILSLYAFNNFCLKGSLIWIPIKQLIHFFHVLVLHSSHYTEKTGFPVFMFMQVLLPGLRSVLWMHR